ncbi:Piso0_001191 [Millerozyma farinosa CBS 7064]|uniref:Piso0_001191 protein n=1 Tax=Pichia sorbitophila (strain ATCC MYA-4447 / BCRC 22081 / CBS 7064 / NBRC 10061 / NRRL Y-12695) TaxID=559304 RepID=G8YSM8_PICSO|nr:Piso0_001191 [Millerozyma farinosa CBS 7064]CCE79151.1 Piso0_001191 [Millerozyma farinosa CBS 7064]
MTGISKRPNFLIIVADDLGFTDLRPFGGEIDTPNLDRLSKGWNTEGTGKVITDFHTAPTCSPTRAMLFSGTDNHIAGLGQMAEYMRTNPEFFKGRAGYEGYLNDRVAPLPEILQDDGYFTWISGKWHLGLIPDYWPIKRGFEKVFTLLPGAGNHYKYFPSLKENELPKLMPPIFCKDDRYLDPEGELPDDFYSTDFYTDRGIEFMLDDSVRKGRPFFGCLTYTAPHWPYQAPPEKVAKYKGKYDQGPEELRKARLAQAIKLGIIPDDVDPHPMTTFKDKRWKDFTSEERKTQSRIMETYAAMVDILDENIGKVIEVLEREGELDNTFILFMSDNGAEGMSNEAVPLGLTHIESFIEKYYNNSYENIGRKDSFTFYGDQWAQAATAPWYKYKAWSSEGGIRCPLLIHYPALIKSDGTNNPRIQNTFTTVMDILPTVLELAGVQHPGELYKGRKVALPRGKSWVSHLAGKSDKVHADDSVTGWELYGQRAVRKGDYKALNIPKPFGNGEWQLFNIKQDPGEVHDLSQQEPAKLEELLVHWVEYVAETGMVEIGDLIEAYPDGSLKPQVSWNPCD